MPISYAPSRARRQASTRIREIRGERVDRRRVVDLALEPALGRAVEDGAADGEALDDAAARRRRRTIGSARPAAPTGPSSTTPRQCGSLAAIARSMCAQVSASPARLQLPPVGLARRDRRSAAARARWCRAFTAPFLRGDDLDQQFVARLAAGVEQAEHLALLALAQIGRIVGVMVERQALDDVVQRPLRKLRADVG